jgi:hypothetical protein
MNSAQQITSWQTIFMNGPEQCVVRLLLGISVNCNGHYQ